MATFKTTHGVGEPRDLYYPNVLTPTKVPALNPKNVQDAFRRIFDMVYGIQPPPGSRSASTIFSTPNFGSNATVKLENKVVFLTGQEWEGSASGASWNAHTLTYNGVAYPISAGGPTTNKYIYWSLNNSGQYQSSATFPTLGVDDFLIAVYNSSDTTTYEFWNAKLAPAFISTALIEDAAITNAKISSLSATKITTGTLAASVEITLTKSDTVPAKLVWQDTGQMYVISTSAHLFLNPTTNKTGTMFVGTGAAATPLNWAAIALNAKQTSGATAFMATHSDTSDDRATVYCDGAADTILFKTAGGSKVQLNGTDLLPTTTNQIGLGSSSKAWVSLHCVGAITSTTGSFRVSTDGQGIGTATNGFSFYEATDKVEGYANNVLSFKFDSTSHATNTNLYIYWNGALKQAAIDTSDLGSGSKNYVYLL